MVTAVVTVGVLPGLLPDVSRLSRRGACIAARPVSWTRAWFRPVYLTILLTHTVLAVVIVPLVLVTLQRARKQRFERAPENRALDLAALDVRLRDRRGDLPLALSDFSATQTVIRLRRTGPSGSSGIKPTSLKQRRRMGVMKSWAFSTPTLQYPSAPLMGNP